MKRLQNKLKNLRLKLSELRGDLFFQSLKPKEKEVFSKAMKLINEFDDILIINYILKK